MPADAEPASLQNAAMYGLLGFRSLGSIIQPGRRNSVPYIVKHPDVDGQRLVQQIHIEQFPFPHAFRAEG